MLEEDLEHLSSATRAEVVVVGAGPAGSATAALLARRGRQVVLLDRARFPRSKPCAEYASPGAATLLDRLGVRVRTGRRLHGMQLIAPNGGQFLIEYRPPGLGPPALALSIQRTELDASLLDLARAGGVEVREQHRVDDLLIEGGAVRGVIGRDGAGRPMRVSARLVVGADGLHSTVVRALGLRRGTLWPRRLGLVAHVGKVPWPEDVGQMWVGARSYVGLAPVADGLLTVGLVTALPRRRLGPAIGAFWAAVAEFPRLQARLAGAEVVDGVHGVGPLAHAVRATAGPGFLLVGDAAGFSDPFTGEGIYRALRGAELAAEAAHQALDGCPEAFPGYERARQRAFGSKQRLTALIQVFVRAPGLMNYAVGRLQHRPRLGQRLGRVLGDLEPADAAIRRDYLWALLRP